MELDFLYLPFFQMCAWMEHIVIIPEKWNNVSGPLVQFHSRSSNNQQRNHAHPTSQWMWLVVGHILLRRGRLKKHYFSALEGLTFIYVFAWRIEVINWRPHNKSNVYKGQCFREYRSSLRMAGDTYNSVTSPFLTLGSVIHTIDDGALGV